MAAQATSERGPRANVGAARVDGRLHETSAAGCAVEVGRVLLGDDGCEL
jgi:hypothetical protein